MQLKRLRINSLREGYNTAISQMSTENAQLKDALREAIELFHEHEDGYMYLNIHDWISKAKQLLTEKEKEEQG